MSNVSGTGGGGVGVGFGIGVDSACVSRWEEQEGRTELHGTSRRLIFLMWAWLRRKQAWLKCSGAWLRHGERGFALKGVAHTWGRGSDTGGAWLRCSGASRTAHSGSVQGG